MTRRFHLHPPAMLYLGLIFVIGLVAMNTQNNLLFWSFGVLVTGLLLSLVVSMLMMRGLVVRRLDPQHGAEGEPLVVRYRVRNRMRVLPIFDVHFEEMPVSDRSTPRLLRRRGSPSSSGAVERRARPWQQYMAPAFGWIMHIAARETTHTDAVFWPTQRGLVRFERLRLWTTFPFGILKRSVTLRQPHHTLVYPRLYVLNRDVLTRFSPAGVLGMRMTQRTGAGDEYFGVREYREGDSMRNIAWKRTARTDELVTIERSNPSPPKLRVVLNLLRATDDLRLTDDSPEAKREAEERAISLAASVLYAADHMGYEIGLSVLGFDLPRMPIRRSRWHLGKMLAALASVDLDASRLEMRRGAVPNAERAGLVMIHPDRVDPSLARDDAWHLTAAQLDTLTSGVLGWDPSRIRQSPEVIESMMQTSGNGAATGGIRRREEAAA